MLFGAMNVAFSGTQVETQRLVTTANNIVNMNTDGFRTGRVVGSEQAGGGVRGTLAGDSGPPSPRTLRDGVVVTLSNTDLAAEFVNQLTSVAAYRADMTVIKTADEMLGTLVDLFA